MDGDFDEMLDLYFTGEAQGISDSPWNKEAILFETNDISVGEDRDIQDLFDGETSHDANDSSSESETESVPPRDVNGICDEDIQGLRLQELNKLIRDFPREEAIKIRKRRRNLKNRSYALTCRLRKQREHEYLINENASLKKQVEDERRKLRNIWIEKEEYKRKYVQLQSAFTVYMQNKITLKISPCS
ncbi:hypothetical protein OS493_005181 [Desmophyllum pertusum]|uniref:Basic leucine zipper domain-containing protein n=1 Tax=Desmophyllum pertusum TaxID=174260 RepID=A0A9W9Z7I5_9CNID|nr:hypothetical protein OS493_005181 [Desmophyllum pertusum]